MALSRGPKISTNVFVCKVYLEPSGSWTSVPKIMHVRTKKCGAKKCSWESRAEKLRCFSMIESEAGLAIRNTNRADSCKSIPANRFAHIDSQQKSYFRDIRRFERIASNLRFAIFSAPKRDSTKRGFSSGTSSDSCESICANLAIQD